MNGIVIVTKIITKQMNVNSRIFNIGDQIFAELNFNDWNFLKGVNEKNRMITIITEIIFK